MKKYQFTLFTKDGKYKPVSCIVEANNRLEFVNHGEAFKRAITKICAQRHWTQTDLIKYGYKIWKVREYLE